MIHVGDCVSVLATLKEKSVHTIITSPPYWLLRDYKVIPTDWPEIVFVPETGLAPMKIPAMTCALGLENDVWEYVAHMVHVFRQARRVLRDDGTLWVNLGDSYSQQKTGVSHNKEGEGGGLQSWKMDGQNVSTITKDLPGKNLVGQPWRVAFALQADGWILRSDLIWAKGMSFCEEYVGSVMPEGATDRPTKAHEYVFMFSKSPRYFYDDEAIKEAVSQKTNARDKGVNPKSLEGKEVWSRSNESMAAAIAGYVPSRSARTVFAIRNRSFKGEHFATYAPELVEKCILAATSASGVCASCGAPMVRVKIVVGNLEHEVYDSEGIKDYEAAGVQNPSDTKRSILKSLSNVYNYSWLPSCECATGLFAEKETVPATVLDIFGGSGTTRNKAIELGRNGVMIELKPEYAAIAENGE